MMVMYVLVASIILLTVVSVVYEQHVDDYPALINGGLVVGALLFFGSFVWLVVEVILMFVEAISG